jgi:hypothetical protein
MKHAGKAVLGGVLFAAAGILSAQAEENNSSIYRSAQGLSHRFGSKLAAGYFIQKDGACALNLFLTENVEYTDTLSASHVKFDVVPGQKIVLNSTEGNALEIKCGAQAATLEVTSSRLSQKFAAR